MGHFCSHWQSVASRPHAQGTSLLSLPPDPHRPPVTNAEMGGQVCIPDPRFTRTDKRAAGKLNSAASRDRLVLESINTRKNWKAINIGSAIHEAIDLSTSKKNCYPDQLIYILSILSNSFIRLFLGKLHTQYRAWTHHPESKSYTLRQWSLPSAPRLGIS